MCKASNVSTGKEPSDPSPPSPPPPPPPPHHAPPLLRSDEQQDHRPTSVKRPFGHPSPSGDEQQPAEVEIVGEWKK